MRGRVTDGTGAALAGATVSLASPALIGGPQQVVTGVDGTYRFIALPPGTYAIEVALDRFRPVRRFEIRVASGSVVLVDLELPIADVAEALEVRGASPVVDVQSAAVPVHLDADLLHNLPTARSITGLINLAPGISADVSFGGSQKSNEILLDGARMTDPLFQDPILRANQNWIQEVTVVALGAPAEHGGFTGASAFALLRSGANRFSGLGEFWTTRPSWLGNNTTDLSSTLQGRFAPRRVLDWRDTNGQVGGPIVRNRLWFFSGLQHARHNDRPAGYTGPGSRDEREVQALVKPTWSVTPALRLDGFIEHGRHRVHGEYIGPAYPLEASNDVWRPQTTWNAHATWAPADTLLFEVRHGGYDAMQREDPHPPATLDGPAPRYDYGTNITSQNTNLYFRQDSRIYTSTASLRYLPTFGGAMRHDIKIGIEHERTRGFQEVRIPGGILYYDYFGVPAEAEIWGGQSARATTGRRALYIQDTWSIGSRVTFSPGIRLEFNRGSVPNQPNVFATNTIAPRVGLAWDVTADHRTVLRAHYGRYHDTIFSSRIMAEDVTDLQPHTYARVVGPDQFEVISHTVPQDRFAIDPELEHSYVAQLVLGVEREVVAGVSVQAQYIRRRFDTFMGLIDTGSVYAPTQLRDPGPDGRLGTADDGELLNVFNLTNPGNQFNVYTNPENAFNKYDAVQIVGRKRYAGDWQLQASYTWSKNRGTVGNRWHVNAARFDLGSPGRFVNPNLYIKAYGRATFDPTHEAKLLGSYRVPGLGGTMVSGVYRYTTGQAWGRTAMVPGFRQGTQRIRIEPQGTRRTPAINRLDLRVEKLLALPLAGGGGRLGLFADVFNVWNQGVPNADLVNAVNDFSGARFGEPGAWTDPRLLRVGVRLQF